MLLAEHDVEVFDGELRQGFPSESRAPAYDGGGVGVWSAVVFEFLDRGHPHTLAKRGYTTYRVAIVRGMFVSGLVNLYTRDIEAGVRFYRDVVGFEETFRTPVEGTPEHVELQLNGFKIGLGSVDAAKRVHGVDASPGSPAMVLVLWVENVDDSYAELVAAGVPALQPPHDSGNNNRNALLRDPDGNLLEIVSKIS